VPTRESSEREIFFYERGNHSWREAQKLTNEEMLEKLRELFKQHGRISGILIDETDGLPSRRGVRAPVRVTHQCYKLIGYDPGIDFSFIEENRRLRQLRPDIVAFG